MSTELQTQLQAGVRDLCEWFDAYYSRFRDDSEVQRWAQKAGTYSLPDHAKPLLDFYQQLYAVSNGAVTPLVGSLLEEAGYDSNYSLQPGMLTTPPAWEEVMEYNGTSLKLHRPVLLDVGAAGKGYLVDLISDYIRSQGVESFCVDGSGDMFCNVERQPLLIGLEHPDDTTLAVGVAQLQYGALCGSAGNRRAWGDFTHIINPHTKSSPQHLKAVWAMADTALLADGLTTALYFCSPDILLKHFSFEYALIRSDGALETSTAFPATFY